MQSLNACNCHFCTRTEPTMLTRSEVVADKDTTATNTITDWIYQRFNRCHCYVMLFCRARVHTSVRSSQQSYMRLFNSLSPGVYKSVCMLILITWKFKTLCSVFASSRSRTVKLFSSMLRCPPRPSCASFLLSMSRHKFRHSRVQIADGFSNIEYHTM